VMKEDSSKLVETLLSSDLKADLLTLFRKNPGIIDTVEGISSRLGTTADSLLSDLKDLTDIGILSTKKVGKLEVVYLNRKRDREVQQIVAVHFQSLKPDEQTLLPVG